MDLISELLPELGSLPDFQPADGVAFGSAAAASPRLATPAPKDEGIKQEFLAAHDQPQASSSSGTQAWSTGNISEAASHHLPYATNKKASNTGATSIPVWCYSSLSFSTPQVDVPTYDDIGISSGELLRLLSSRILLLGTRTALLPL